MKSGSGETFQKCNIQLVINIITVIGVFAFMLYLTARCPYITDDWHFKFVWKDFSPTGSDTRVSGLGDIFTSVKNYYLKSGGRVLCHFAAYIFVNINKNIFNVLNAFMFLLLGMIIYRTAARFSTPPKHNCLLLLIYAAMMVFIPVFGDVCLWLSGAVNYLWSAVLLFACFLLIDKCFDDLTLKKALLMSVPTAISAATNEVTGGMLIVFMVLTFFVKKKEFSPLYLIPVLAALPGIFFVLLAPGNFVRAKTVDIYGMPDRTDMLHCAKEYFDGIKKNTVSLFMTVLLSFVMKLIDTLKAKQTKSLKSTLKNAFCILAEYRYAITGFVGVMALSASPPTQRPLIFGYVCFLAEAFSSLFYIFGRIEKRNTRYKIKSNEAWYFALTLLMPFYIRYLGTGMAVLTAVLTETIVFIAQRMAEKNKRTSVKSPIQFSPSLALCCAAAVIFISMIAKDTVKYNRGIDKTNDYFAQLNTAVSENDLQTVIYLRFEPFDEIGRLFSNEFRKSGDSYTREWYVLYVNEQFGNENLQVMQLF